MVLDECMGGSVRFFLSSHWECLPGGNEWLQTLRYALGKAKMALFVVTEAFLESRWCALETGGAYFRQIPLIPVCPLGMSVDRLPEPLRSLQGYNLREATHLESVIRDVATVIDYRPDFAALDYESMLLRLGVGEYPSVNEELENRFRDYCLSLIQSTHLTDRLAGARMLSGLRNELALQGLLSAAGDASVHVRKCALTSLHTMSEDSQLDLVGAILDVLLYITHEEAREHVALLSHIAKKFDLPRIEVFMNSCPDAQVRSYLSDLMTSAAPRL